MAVSNESDNNACQTVFLSDEPTDNDAFGGHDRIAKALSEIFTDDNQVGGKAIALSGGWGSGKSTVIKILEDKYLKNNTNIALFNFNSWIHHGDPLRRAFLETILNYLKSEECIEENKIKKILSKLNNIRETTTISKKNIIYLFIFLLIVPLSIQIISKYQLYFIESSKFFTSLGFLLIFIPILVLLFFELIFRNNNILTETNKSFTTKDPSSIEFTDYFKEILDIALKDEKRKLIIVIDNLDRLDPKEALSIWSTMRIFFESYNKREQSWFDRFWLIVPYDPNGIKKLWENSVNNQEEQDKPANAFLDKTFQIKFDVPPPILSDWKEYFINQLKKAFPFYNDEIVYYEVYSIFNMEIPRERSIIAPRDIIKFINNLVAVYRQWLDLVYLPIQALYVLKRDEIEKPIEDIVNFSSKEYLISRYPQRYIIQMLSALYFNVHPENANEIIINYYFDYALRDGDSEKLLEFKDFPDFIEVCAKNIDLNLGDWARSDQKKLIISSEIISSLKDYKSYSLKRIWESICFGLSKVDVWKYYDNKFGNKIIKIIEKIEGNKLEEYMTKIIKSLVKTATEISYGNINIDIRNWSVESIKVIEKIHKLKFKNIIKQEFYLPGNPDYYIQALGSLYNKNISDEIVEYCIPDKKTNPDEIIDFLGKSLNTKETGYAIYNMLLLNIEWQWNSLIKEIENRFKKFEPLLTIGEFFCYIFSLISLTNKKKTINAENSLKSLKREGLLYHYLKIAYDGKDYEACACFIFAIWDIGAQGNVATGYKHSSEGHDFYRKFNNSKGQHPEIIEEITKLVINFDKIEKVKSDITNRKFSSFLEDIIEKIKEKNI